MAKKKHTEYYKLVGCEVNDTPDGIKKAYRRTALELHPDRGGDVEEFKRMKAAYDVISVPQKRKMYDNYGPDAVKMMEGEVPRNMELFTYLRKRDKIMIVAVLTLASLLLLAFPVLLSIRFDALWDVTSPYSWFIPAIPLYLIEAMIGCIFAVAIKQPPLDMKNPNIDEEARAAWRQQEIILNISRAKFFTLLALLVIFEILVPLQLDGTIFVSPFVVTLPMTLFFLILLSFNIFLAPAVFTATDPDFNRPDEEGNVSNEIIQYCSTLLLSKPKFWLFFIGYIKWNLALLLTILLSSFVATKNLSGVYTSYWIAAIPLLIVIAVRLLVIVISQFVNSKPPQTEDDQEQKQPEEASSFLGDVIVWTCTYGLILIIVCTAAAKLSNPNVFSAFVIFSPVFFFVVVTCFCLSCFFVYSGPENSNSSSEADSTTSWNCREEGIEAYIADSFQHGTSDVVQGSSTVDNNETQTQ